MSQRLRISLALAVREFLGELLVKSKLPMSFFEAEIPSERYPIGRLNRINLLQINHLIKGQLQALRLPLVFTGVNISLIEDRLSKTAFFLQARVSGVIIGFSARRARKALKQLYPGDRWEQYLRDTLGCAFPDALSKTVWPESVRQVESLYPRMGAATYREFATMTEYLPIMPPRIREFAEWLGQYEMSVRMLYRFVAGVRRVSS